MKRLLMNDSIKNLITTVKKLRSDTGCEWDRKQTDESLLPYLLEEAYEVAEAVIAKNKSAIKEELGDLLLHIIFQAVVLEEKSEGDLSTIANQINQKLVSRHPEIFNKEQSDKQNWEIQKKVEKKRKSVLDGVPKELPALLVSQRYQEKSASIGFEWDNFDQVLGKVEEEFIELKNAIKNNDIINIEEEIGDILTAIVNLARFKNLSAEVALIKSNQKFYNRFFSLEKKIANSENNSLERLLKIWDEVKNEQRK